MIFPAVWLNLQNSAADMWNQSIAPRNPRHSPFKHHQQHPHSHPTRNTPGHLPAEHLPPKSALEHHQIHRWQHSQPLLRSSAATNTPHRTFNSTTPSATPQATPCATPADHIRDQIHQRHRRKHPWLHFPTTSAIKHCYQHPIQHLQPHPRWHPPPSQQPEKYRYHLPLESSIKKEGSNLKRVWLRRKKCIKRRSVWKEAFKQEELN